MELKYYGFAFFIFLLVCGVLLVYRLLFSEVRQQQKLLGEKEAKLLKLYQSVEAVMEEFYDSAEQLKGEISRQMRELDHLVKSIPAPPPKPPVDKKAEPAAQPKEGVMRGAATFNEAMKAAEEIPAALAQTPVSVWVGKRGEILRMHREGKSQSEIARDLGITQNEVALVLGLNKN